MNLTIREPDRGGEAGLRRRDSNPVVIMDATTSAAVNLSHEHVWQATPVGVFCCVCGVGQTVSHPGATLGRAVGGAGGGVTFFEHPVPHRHGICEWQSCPCGRSGVEILRGEGYMYIPLSVVEQRRDCPSWAQFEMKAELARLRDGEWAFVGIDEPLLVCEAGARMLGLDLRVAREDARYWWATSRLPLRPTPWGRAVSAPGPATRPSGDS